MQLKVITPEAVLVDTQVDQVVVKTSDGSMGILDHHAALIGTLVPAPLMYKNGETWTEIKASAGVIEIQDNKVLVLLDQ